MGMKALTRIEKPDYALFLWKEMISRGIEASPPAYTAAIVAYNQEKKYNKAADLVDIMELENMCPLRIGCEHALMAYEELADYEKALKLLDRMWEYGITPDEMSY